MISLVGGSIGSLGWGALAERLGRRRTLVSCLAVNAVFAAIAAFMPTYGTFMMARYVTVVFVRCLRSIYSKASRVLDRWR